MKKTVLTFGLISGAVSSAMMLLNPIVNAAITFREPFPIGLAVSLITAGVLRRRTGPPAAPAAAVTR